MVGADDPPQVLGVESGRECGRPHQVAKHDRELAALGLISLSWLDRHRCRRCCDGNRSAAEIADRAQHFQPVPKRDAEIFEMLLGQVGKNGNIDLVFGKALSVLGHAEIFEPLLNLLHGSHQTVSSWYDRVSAIAEVILAWISTGPDLPNMVLGQTAHFRALSLRNYYAKWC